MGIVAGTLLAISMVMGKIATDPPRPFERIVEITQRTPRVSKTTDPALSSINNASQHGVSTIVTAYAYLDALERLAGAQNANELSWAITHWGVAVQCRRTLLVNMATTAAALYSAAQKVATSAHNVPLNPPAGTIRKWIETPGVQEDMEGHLTEVGLLPTEVKAAVQHWKSDPSYTGSAATLAAELEQSATMFHGFAVQLDATTVPTYR